jgi:hypothetical protein
VKIDESGCGIGEQEYREPTIRGQVLAHERGSKQDGGTQEEAHRKFEVWFPIPFELFPTGRDERGNLRQRL